VIYGLKRGKWARANEGKWEGGGCEKQRAGQGFNSEEIM
jgi:hypothetical protein